MKRELPGFYEAEERNKLSHFTVQGFDLNGVVQGGANDGEEIENFIRMGVEHLIGFEPLTSAFEILDEKYGLNAHVFKLGLHDTNSMGDLQVTAGDGKGSSLFDGVWDHPEVERNWNQGQAAIVAHEQVELVRFDTWAKQFNNKFYIDSRGNKRLIDLSQYDTLQLDTQGNEMEILLGMGKWLKQFKYLCIELSVTPVYKGETPGAEVAAWLKTQGFTLDSPIYEHNDCFFVRSDIKPTSDQQYKGRC